MFRVTAAALIVSGFAQATDAQVEHGRYDFPFVMEGNEHILTYEGTHDVVRESDPELKLVVFVHHGGSQNPVTYFNNMKAALDAADADRPELGLADTTMIIAPGMIGSDHIADHPDRYSEGHYPYWSGSWREGANSVNGPEVSNYDLLDGMVLHIADRFPGVNAIVHFGHSAGGQLVSRYSVGTPVYDSLRADGIFVRYIISNPSSVLYFDEQRPDLNADEGFVDYSGRTPVVAGEKCPKFNEYKYGLDERDPYMARRPVATMIAGYRKRQVYMFLGLEDNDPTASGVDQSCPALLQGGHRLERGQRYYKYWGHFFGPEVYENKFIEFVPEVSHDHAEMFLSEAGKSILFFDAGSVAASIRAADRDDGQPNSL